MLKHSKLEQDLIALNKSYNKSVVDYANKKADIIISYFEGAQDITGDQISNMNKGIFRDLIIQGNKSYSTRCRYYYEKAFRELMKNAKFRTATPPPGGSKEISSIVTHVPNIDLREIFALNRESIETKQKKYALKIKKFALGLLVDINYMTTSTPPVPAVLKAQNIR